MKKHWTVWPKESYIWFLKTVGKGWNFHRSFGQMRCVSIFVDPTIHCVPAPISQPISLWQMFCRWRDVIAKARFINLGWILKWPFRNGDDVKIWWKKCVETVGRPIWVLSSRVIDIFRMATSWRVFEWLTWAPWKWSALKINRWSACFHYFDVYMYIYFIYRYRRISNIR